MSELTVTLHDTQSAKTVDATGPFLRMHIGAEHHDLKPEQARTLIMVMEDMLERAR